MTEVVAALIWEGEKFMICQRPAHKARGTSLGVCRRQGGARRNQRTGTHSGMP